MVLFSLIFFLYLRKKLSKLKTYKKHTLKKCLIFQEMELSSLKLKKLLIFQEETLKVPSLNKSFIFFSYFLEVF